MSRKVLKVLPSYPDEAAGADVPYAGGDVELVELMVAPRFNFVTSCIGSDDGCFVELAAPLKNAGALAMVTAKRRRQES